MQIGMVGLGKMGANMVRRLMRAGHECHVYDKNAQNTTALQNEGAKPSTSIKSLVKSLQKPRAVWVMVPAGEITNQAIDELSQEMESGDTIIDGGNTFFKDDLERADKLEKKGIRYLDVGTSGGVWGLERGYCLMIGGPKDAFQQCEQIFSALATSEKGYLHCGPTGAGHFAKMIHNGIEYGLMQAYAEGFHILQGTSRYDFDLAAVAEVWRHGSVVSSWLLDLTASALSKDQDLSQFDGHVQDSGEGRWTVQTAVEEAIPADVLTTALYKRFSSRIDQNFADKLLSAMRFEFGGHQERK